MEKTFKAPDIECAGCAASISKALSGTSGVNGVTVDVRTKAVTVSFDEEKTSAEALKYALTDIGFPPEGV